MQTVSIPHEKVTLPNVNFGEEITPRPTDMIILTNEDLTEGAAEHKDEADFFDKVSIHNFKMDRRHMHSADFIMYVSPHGDIKFLKNRKRVKIW